MIIFVMYKPENQKPKKPKKKWTFNQKLTAISIIVTVVGIIVSCIAIVA